MTQANNVAIESSQINSSGVLLTTGGGTGLSTVGTNGQVLTSNGTTLSWVTPTTTSPGGSNTQIQYNSSGSFAGSASLTFDGNNLTVSGSTAGPKVNISSAALGTAMQLSDNTNYGANFIGISGGMKLQMNGTQILTFNQATNGEIMRIDSSGNVLIGTTSGSNKLQINGNGAVVRNGADAYFYIQETSSTNFAQALVLADSTTSWYVVNRYGGSPVGASGFGIGTSNAGNMLQIDTSGNVYLGTAGTSIYNSSGRPILNQTGGILQVVNATYATQTSTTSSSFVDTGLTATITPSSTSSKILVFVSQTGLQKPATDIRVQLQVVRNGSNIIYFESEILYNGGSTGLDAASSVTYLDSPATTSATTYKTQIRIGSGSGTVYWNTVGGSSITGAATITLMEVAG